LLYQNLSFLVERISDQYSPLNSILVAEFYYYEYKLSKSQEKIKNLKEI